MQTVEQAIIIQGTDGVELEGRWAAGDSADGVVLCHPHPQYGGTMDNNVVIAARDYFSSQGFGTLRFNFRGAGQSTGQFSQGVGEAADVSAACAFVGQQSGVERIHAVGYSFGAFAVLHAIDRGLEVSSCALIAPPVSAMSFDNLTLPDRPCLIVAGDADTFCDSTALEQWLQRQPSSTHERRHQILTHTDHFFWGAETELQEALARGVVRETPKEG